MDEKRSSSSSDFLAVQGQVSEADFEDEVLALETLLSDLANSDPVNVEEHNKAGVSSNSQAQQVVTEESQQLEEETALVLLDSEVVSQILGCHDSVPQSLQNPVQQPQQQELTQESQQQKLIQEPEQQELDQQSAQQESTQQVQQQESTQQVQQQKPEQETRPYRLCKIGQVTVSEIMTTLFIMFKNLLCFKPPNGTSRMVFSTHRQVKITECIETIQYLLKELRWVYNACNENSLLQELKDIDVKSLIPYKEEGEAKSDEETTSEAHRHDRQERGLLIKEVTVKNRQLKEIIDHMRLLISEITIMLHNEKFSRQF